MTLLKEVLEYLYKSTYAVKDDELIRIFQNYGFMNDGLEGKRKIYQ